MVTLGSIIVVRSGRITCIPITSDWSNCTKYHINVTYRIWGLCVISPMLILKQLLRALSPAKQCAGMNLFGNRHLPGDDPSKKETFLRPVRGRRSKSRYDWVTSNLINMEFLGPIRAI